jgi:hypothetical protein
MKERMEAFLRDLDEALAAKTTDEVLDLYHIGRSALVWAYNYSSTTQDFDIVRPQGGETLLRAASTYSAERRQRPGSMASTSKWLKTLSLQCPPASRNERPGRTGPGK